MTATLLAPTDFQTLLTEIKKHVSKPEEKPMCRKDAMEFLGIGKTALNNWMNSGAIPFHRLNGRPVFYASEINDFIKRKK